MRRIATFGMVFTLGCALGWLAHRPVPAASGRASSSGATPEVVTVAYPDNSTQDGRSVRTLHVVQVKTGIIGENESLVAPKTEPEKTWVISLGKYGEPGWASFVAVVP